MGIWRLVAVGVPVETRGKLVLLIAPKTAEVAEKVLWARSAAGQQSKAKHHAHTGTHKWAAMHDEGTKREIDAVRRVHPRNRRQQSRLSFPFPCPLAFPAGSHPLHTHTHRSHYIRCLHDSFFVRSCLRRGADQICARRRTHTHVLHNTHVIHEVCETRHAPPSSGEEIT